ncbi:DUF4262 domain-containing protein [Actinomadura atramentaria]|uniref:DUF4262 domain-containing protein n=1 Tax=Actinomadura atramentaria TaxID=1990 RepID=UPI0005272ED8|nr:DUF4262 domain-containing protein [Actinomadura atramentaria]
MSPRPPCHCVLCRDYGDRRRLDHFLLRTIVHITEYGWSTVLVQPEGGLPGWAYTIGLWHSHRAPELAMFGADVYETEEILNALGRRTAAGTGPDDGERRPAAVRGRPAEFRAADVRWYAALLPGAVSFYRRPPLPFLQVVWADEAGLPPWDAAAAPDFRAVQPWLWLDPERHPSGPWTRRLRAPGP